MSNPSQTEKQDHDTSDDDADVNNEERLDVLIEELRELLTEEPSSWRRDDGFLAKFLRVRGYDIQRALVSVRKYYQNVDQHLELTSNIRPTHFESIYEAQVLAVLGGRCKLGSKVALAQPSAWDVREHAVRAIQQASLLLCEEAILDKATQLSGFSAILDLSQLSFAHLRQLTPTVLYQIISHTQDGLPVRVVGLHFINYPTIFWSLFYVIRGLLKEKLRRRIHFHKTTESLHAHFHVEHLPESLGGQLQPKQAVDSELYDTLLRNDKSHEAYYTVVDLEEQRLNHPGLEP